MCRREVKNKGVDLGQARTRSNDVGHSVEALRSQSSGPPHPFESVRTVEFYAFGSLCYGREWCNRHADVVLHAWSSFMQGRHSEADFA